MSASLNQKALLKMIQSLSFNAALEPTLQEVLQVIKPLRPDWETRIRVIEELRNVVQSVESLRGATVQPFGSFVSNLFTRSGDLDISIDLYSGSSILYAGKKQKQTLLGHVLRALRGTGGWYRLQFVVHARVPILKIVSRFQGISCDISINNLEGLLKSKFLFWINEIDGRFRDMVLLVKEWAKAHDINNPKVGTFNSYSLSLLVIFHFQTCVPAILPPLREIYPSSAVDDLTGVRAAAEENIAKISAANIARFKSDKSRAVNRSSLSELFVSFLAKFSDINLKAQELGVCPFTGRWENINSNTRWQPKTYSLFIEDPFEQPENAARSVSRKQLDNIALAFETSRQCLVSGIDRSSLLAVLAQPHISLFPPRPPINVPSHNINGVHKFSTLGAHVPFPGQPSGGAVHVRHQLQQNRSWNGNPSRKNITQTGGTSTNSIGTRQNQIQNVRPEGYVLNGLHMQRNQVQNVRPTGYVLNGVHMQRPVLKYPSQGQQVWRPKSEK